MILKKKQAAIEEQIKTVLIGIYRRFRDNPGLVLSEERKKLVEEQLPAIFAAYQQRVKSAGNVKKILEDLDKSELLTFAYNNFRVMGGTDYSSLNLFYQDTLAGGEVLLNGGVSLNHEPEGNLNQDTIRDYSAALSFEWSVPYLSEGKFNERDLSPTTLSFSGKVMRLENADDEVFLVQAKTTVPFVDGFALPIAVTWGSRTEQKDDEEFRINVGLDLNTDKLIALSRMVLGN